jgi:uncharacterized membrane protein YbhN (UPF0104 family)
VVVVAIVALFALGTFLSTPTGDAAHYAGAIRTSSFLLVGVVVVALAIVLAVGMVRRPLAAWVDRRSSWSGRWVGRTLLSLADGTEALRRPRLLLPITVHSLLAWLTIALGTWIGIRAVGADVPFAASLVMLPPLALGVALPTPGGAGGYHAAMSFVLIRIYGVPEAVAVGAGLLMHLMVVLPTIVLGLILLRVDGLHWHDLTAMVRQMGTLGSEPAPAPAERTAEAVR